MKPPIFTLAELAIVPSLIAAYLLVALQVGGLDDRVASWFYDPAANGFPLQNDFWMRDVLHHDARNGMIGVLLAVIAGWIATFRIARLRVWRLPLGYLAGSMLLGVLLVNVGKQLSNTDCPWDLIGFGGDRPRILLFESRPAHLPRARCFPGGHSSSGYALFGLYFVARLRGARHAAPWLLPGLLLGGVFSVAQWSRGAHFPSHDLASAYVCWMSAWFIYVIVRRRYPPLRTVGVPP